MFNVRDAALLVGQDMPEVATSLGRLVQLRYLRSVDGGFRFHHPLVHEVAYHRLTLQDRMRLHASCAAKRSMRTSPQVSASPIRTRTNAPSSSSNVPSP